MVRVIDMTFPYDARYSMVLPRPKHDLQLSTPSADTWICMGTWPVPTRGMLCLGLQDGPRRADVFSGAALATDAVPEKNGARTEEGAGAKNKMDARIEREVQCSPMFGRCSCVGPSFQKCKAFPSHAMSGMKHENRKKKLLSAPSRQ